MISETGSPVKLLVTLPSNAPVTVSRAAMGDGRNPARQPKANRAQIKSGRADVFFMGVGCDLAAAGNSEMILESYDTGRRNWCARANHGAGARCHVVGLRNADYGFGIADLSVARSSVRNPES